MLTFGTPTRKAFRTPEAQPGPVNLTARRQPKTWEYYLKSTLIGTIGEAAYRRFDLTNMFSFTFGCKKLDDLTGLSLSKWIPFASAQEATAQVTEVVADAGTVAAQETAEAVSRTWGDLLPSYVTDSGLCTADVTTHHFSTVSGYLSENCNWLVMTGGVAFVAAGVNHLTCKAIKNPWLRNPVSIAVGSAVVWGAATAMGYPASISDTADIGLRLLVTNGVGKVAAPVGQFALKLGYAGLETLKWSFSYPDQRSKIHVS